MQHRCSSFTSKTFFPLYAQWAASTLCTRFDSSRACQERSARMAAKIRCTSTINEKLLCALTYQTELERGGWGDRCILLLLLFSSRSLALFLVQLQCNTAGNSIATTTTTNYWIEPTNANIFHFFHTLIPFANGKSIANYRGSMNVARKLFRFTGANCFARSALHDKWECEQKTTKKNNCKLLKVTDKVNAMCNELWQPSQSQYVER